MRYNLESGLPVQVSDDQGPAAIDVTDGMKRRRAEHVARLALKRLSWWPSWTPSLGMGVVYAEHVMVYNPEARFEAIGSFVIRDV